ncbi:hypothetical protein C8J41_103254 [Sphingomonas sp. PP-CC-3G-468]|nr:hypothetical protein C8J41_103254 [Sphingomonas sp. PP-CC-3G-468]
MKAKVYEDSANECTQFASFGSRRSTPSMIDGVGQTSDMLVRNARGILFATDRDVAHVCDTRLDDGHAGFKDSAAARPGFPERIRRCVMACRPTIGRWRAAEMRIDPVKIGSDGLTLHAPPGSMISLVLEAPFSRKPFSYLISTSISEVEVAGVRGSAKVTGTISRGPRKANQKSSEEPPSRLDVTRTLEAAMAPKLIRSKPILMSPDPTLRVGALRSTAARFSAWRPRSSAAVPNR